MTKPAHNQHLVLAGTRGHIRSRPDIPLVVCALHPGSIAPARKGYRWICLDPEGNKIFAPFRDFELDSETDL